MEFELLTPGSHRWNAVIDYAENCSWSAGAALARAMKNREFTDWERVAAAVDDGAIAGCCTVSKTDCLPQASYTPYIGFLFVGEEYRGRRLSQRLIQFAMDYLKSIGFDRVYLTSDLENLYEKYGFAVIDRQRAYWGAEEKVYMRML